MGEEKSPGHDGGLYLELFMITSEAEKQAVQNSGHAELRWYMGVSVGNCPNKKSSEMKMPRWSQRKARKDIIKNETIRGNAKMRPIKSVLTQQRADCHGMGM